MSEHIDYEKENARRMNALDKTGLDAASNLTVRDYFAAKVMAAWITSDYVEFGDADHSSEAEQAYRVADAMMKERAK